MIVIFSVENDDLIIHMKIPIIEKEKIFKLIEIYEIGNFKNLIIKPIKKLNYFENRSLQYSGFDEIENSFIYCEN